MTSALLYHSLCNSVDVFCLCYFAVTKSISNSSRLNCFFCPSIASTLFVREVGANLQLGLNVMSRQKSCASTSSATPPVRATVTFVPWVRHPPHLSGIGSQCAAPTGCFCNCSPQKMIVTWVLKTCPVEKKDQKFLLVNLPEVARRFQECKSQNRELRAFWDRALFLSFPH